MSKEETKVNEYGDKVGFREVCQGILVLASIGALVACGCIRGCQEINKKLSKSEKVKAIQVQKATQAQHSR